MTHHDQHDNRHHDQHGADLRDLLDSSFGDGPAPLAPTDRLTPGRRALRRRRQASGGTVLAVAAVVAGLALTTGPGGPGGRAVEPADAPPPATTTSAPTVEPDSPPFDPDSEPSLVTIAALRSCLEAVAGRLEVGFRQVETAMLTYDPESGVLTLPGRQVRADIRPVGDPARMRCEVEGAPVTGAGSGEGQR